MKTIRKKITKQFFEAILDGRKTYELRLNDFDIESGDTLILEEHDDQNNLTGRTLERKVTYVGKVDINNLHWSKEDILEKGLQIIALK